MTIFLPLLNIKIYVYCVFKLWSILLIYTLKNQTDQLHLLVRFDSRETNERRSHLFLNIYLLQEDGINNNKF